MKKASQILREMGFRAEGSEAVKEAFIRHLIKAAIGVEVQPGPNEKKAMSPQADQLSFDFSEKAEVKKSS